MEQNQQDSLLEKTWFTKLLAGVLVVQVIVLGFSLKYRDQIVEYAQKLPVLVRNVVIAENGNINLPRPFE